jgi:hypothetical protein
VDDNQARLIIIAVDQCLALPTAYTLTKAPSEIEDRLYAFWDPDRKEWDAQDAFDPLTCLLLCDQPERCKKEDDNQIIATLSVHLQRRPAWVRSFLDGWFGPNNQHGSISGYVLGERLRRKYL